MFRSVKTVSAIVLLVSLMLLGVAQQASQAIRPGCANTEIARVLSPDAAHAAVLFARDCGATTGPSTQVSIVRAQRESSNLPGNVLATREAGSDLMLRWRDDRTLEITGIRGELIRQREQLEDFSIHYHP
ncbi:MAG TPA: hypothetical protein ENN42_00470 [Thioalkalivibrio sp.]|nr:hypothetical protein [Thioalkalivibrio sp.]